MKGDLERKYIPTLYTDAHADFAVDLSTATFAWMLHVISPHITIDQAAFKTYMFQYQRWLNRARWACTTHHTNWADWFSSKIPSIPIINPGEGPLAAPRRDPPHTHPTFDYGWGTGPIVDSYGGMYTLAGTAPRVPGACQAEFYDEKTKEYKLEDIEKYGETNEYIHPICEYRKIIRGNEPNGALRHFTRKFEKSNSSKGRFWWHREGATKPVPEWVILEHHEHILGEGVSADGEVNFERAWYEQCEKGDDKINMLTTEGYTKDFLDALDEQNDFKVGEKEQWMYP